MLIHTGAEVMVLEHVALEAASGGEVLAAAGHRTPRPQGTRVLLVLLRVDVQAAPRRELGTAAYTHTVTKTTTKKKL